MLPSPGAETGPAAPYPSTIIISGVGTIPATPGSVQVTIHEFHHTFPSDIAIVLVGPTGAAFDIQDGEDHGGGLQITPVTYTLSDTGATQLPNGGIILPATYKPTAYANHDFPFPGPGSTYANPGPFAGGTDTFASVYGGTNADGVWRLYAIDAVAGDFGSIDGGWSLTFTTEGCATTPTPSPTETPTPTHSVTPSRLQHQLQLRKRQPRHQFHPTYRHVVGRQADHYGFNGGTSAIR